MKQVMIRGGTAAVADIPTPMVSKGTVLVRVANSCISAGTEGARIGSGSGPGGLIQRAVQNPDLVKRAVEMTLRSGVRATVAAVRGSDGLGSPTGYSVAGTVEEVGEGVKDLRPGDRVACAGAGLANHAEMVAVPRNLVARIPDGVDFRAASTVTLGAIALHGVRRAEPTLGERFVVIGLGVLGQLTAQLLAANGCVVVGSDLEKSRAELALSLGMDSALPQGGDAVEHVRRLTGGVGCDGVIITASTPSSDLLSQAFRMCRPKGRVVVVGDVGLAVDRSDIYRKEVEFRISTSYGPGRYDPRYEEDGLDYPIGYVRWTENRNMEEYLRLVAKGVVRLAPLVQEVFPLERADAAFEALRQRGSAPLVLLEYPAVDRPERRQRSVRLRSSSPSTDRIRLGIIGAGTFTRHVHIPNLQSASDLFDVVGVANRTGVSARKVAGTAGAEYATTDPAQILEDTDIDAVLIGTRHDLHAELTLAALRAGKHVLVEKPLATTAAEIDALESFFRDAEGSDAITPIMLTGYNRRFSPFARRLRDHVRERLHPLVMTYRMNAGYLPDDHWVHGPEGGGRNVGEACHIYDLFLYLVDSPAATVRAMTIEPERGYYRRDDNFTATIGYEDGSIATLTYTAAGHRDLPKERLELFGGGTAAVLDDYRQLTIAGGRGKELRTKRAEKGHLEELRAFGEAIRAGGPWPIPLWQQLEVARTALAVQSAWDAPAAALVDE